MVAAVKIKHGDTQPWYYIAYLCESLTGMNKLFTHILECISDRMCIAVEWVSEHIKAR